MWLKPYRETNPGFSASWKTMRSSTRTSADARAYAGEVSTPFGMTLTRASGRDSNCGVDHEEFFIALLSYRGL